ENVPVLSKIANCWRTTGDIRDNWWSVTGIGFTQTRWAPYQSQGHWNDPDMLVVGYVGGWGGRQPKPSGLSPDEQYTHITLWSLLASPLLIGCDMTRLDEFTLNLLTNDEVLAVNQDALGKQAVQIVETGQPVTIVRSDRPEQKRTLKPYQIWARPLEDGSIAVGLFNLSDQPAPITASWKDLKLTGRQTVRDLWRQKELGQYDEQFQMVVAPHGAELVKIKSVVLP
ncbi:MAG TPA: hypothetical protein PKW71_06815, partial [Anaerohalosphaeraceae bacterium]|nr:hypothetical protein [Anaerohalosphaeraceae bacterium]